jgi:hypothetical protein
MNMTYREKISEFLDLKSIVASGISTGIPDAANAL